MSDTVLTGYRQSIDNIDAALVFMLAERFKITQAVGRYKAENELPPADPGRDSQGVRPRMIADDHMGQGAVHADSRASIRARRAASTPRACSR